MPDCVIKILQKLEHRVPNKPQHSPQRWVPKTYGQNINLAPSEDTSDTLSPQDTRNIQHIVGSFLYYTRAVDNKIHTSVNDIGSAQSKPTKKTNEKSIMLMGCLYTHPNAKIRYYASAMQSYIVSDAAYLVAPKEKTRISGYFYLGDKYIKGSGNPNPKLNGPVHIEYQLLKHVVSSTKAWDIRIYWIKDRVNGK